MANNMEPSHVAPVSARPLPRVFSGWRYWSTTGTALYVAVLALVSSHFALSYVTSTNPYLNLADYVGGNAPLPFQYRALTSWVISLGSSTPIIGWLSEQLPAPFSRPEQLMVLLVVATAMACLVEISRRSILALTSDREFAAASAFLAPAAAYVTYVAIANTYRLSFPYDVPALMFFSLGYYFILKENHVGFSLAFVLATSSKETAIFLLVAFACHRFVDLRSLLSRDGYLLAFLLGVFLAIKLALVFIYGDNLRETALGHQPALTSDIPGALFVFQLQQNLDNLASPQYWPSILSFVGWLWLIVLFGWRLLDRADIRRTLLVITPLWFLTILIAGRVTEVRVFGEMIPLFVVGAAVIGRNWLLQRGYGRRMG
jgi:hypothetical protein